MIAQRTRLTAISGNIANQNAVDADGTPYRARVVMLSAGDPTAANPSSRELGVHVSDIEIDQSPFQLRYDPGNPRAIKTGANQGYVPVSNVNPVKEQFNAMQASRAYEANTAAAEATKAMLAQALRLLA